LRSSNSELRMSVEGHERLNRPIRIMSALARSSDIVAARWHFACSAASKPTIPNRSMILLLTPTEEYHHGPASKHKVEHSIPHPLEQGKADRR
jgi:hypothetical protein